MPKPGTLDQETILLATFKVEDAGAGVASRVTRVQSQRFARFKTAFTAAEATEIEVRFAKFPRAAGALIRRAG